MTVKKIGISLPEELYETLQADVESGRAGSVSERIAGLIDAERQRDEWLAEQAQVFGMLPNDPERDAYWTARLRSTPEEILAENRRDGLTSG